ncbi:oligosaccharide flippase family protein [Granulosicoccaceae sp. 1_MG-2023]|nr:oligosaccharide flippase family protein [Granulosicoccaceae sp. 1_MG-2023]
MPAGLNSLFSRFRLDGEMMSGTLWMMLSYGVKLGLQLVSFVLLARELGAESFGVYMALLSFVILLEPFFDLGAYHLVVDDITGKVPTGAAIGNSIALSLMVFPIGMLAMYLGYLLIFDQVTYLMLFEVGLSQFIGGRTISLTLGVNIAHGKMRRNAVLEMINGLIRLIVVSFLFLTGGGLEEWIHIQLAGNAVFALLVFFWWRRHWKLTVTGLTDIRRRLLAGMHFAIGNTARNANTEIDKIMIYRFASVEGTGIYAAATRFAVMSIVPVNALLSTVHRYFFIEGKKGYSESRRYAKRMLPITAAYGVFAAIVLYFFADLLIGLLGEDFREAVDALHYLAVYPLILSIMLPYGDALTGSSLQHVRARGTIYSMITNICLNLVLIPFFGWKGAIVATLISQTLLMLFVTVYASRYKGFIPEPRQQAESQA